jgi:hypothetical protein
MVLEAASQQTAALQLPTQIVGPVDVARLIRELEALEDFLHQASIREPGSQSPKLPRTSRLLDELVALNHLSLLSNEDRQRVTQLLAELKEHAPRLHISFARDPSAAFTDKIITWLRQNIHPELLLRIGLEPTIAAGCIVRTPNRLFDFSLRQHFIAQRQTLIKLVDNPETETSHE